MDNQERITDDPKYLKAARSITAEYGESGEPMSWRIQEDGTLTVILPSGKKINRPIPSAPPKEARPAAGTATSDAERSTPPPTPAPRTKIPPRRKKR